MRRTANGAREVIGVILGGGQGARLFPLTQFRSKPAVPIGDKYRLIDIPISNCLHSGIDRIVVLTQFNSASLHRHISTTYRFDFFSSERYVEILAAEQTQENRNWYQGTADAVRKQLHRILSRRPALCLILSGDHLYRMDYQPFIESHCRREADVSIAVKPVNRDQAPELGILKMAGDGRIVDFLEKPQTEAQLDDLALAEGMEDDPSLRYLASMGIYLFEPEVLISLLLNTTHDDFGKHIIPSAIHTVGVYAFPFAGYWEDIGTIGAFYRANLALTEDVPKFDFHDAEAPVYTHPGFLAGARIGACRIDSSIVAEGCRIHAAEIRGSVVGLRSIIGAGVYLRDTVMMGADYYEGPADRERNAAQGIPDIGIGTGAIVERAIIDKNARIGERAAIRNLERVREADRSNYYVRDGVVVVPKDAVIPPGTAI